MKEMEQIENLWHANEFVKSKYMKALLLSLFYALKQRISKQQQ